MNFQVNVSSNVDLNAKAQDILEAMKRQTNIELIRLQSYVVQQKLSGQVLEHRSGKLIDSVRVRLAQIQGYTVSGSVEGAGGPAWYGRLFEEGGKAPYPIVPVNKRVLAWQNASGATVFARRVMHPPAPKKPWLSPALDELRSTIITNIQTAVNNAVGPPSTP